MSAPATLPADFFEKGAKAKAPDKLPPNFFSSAPPIPPPPSEEQEKPGIWQRVNAGLISPEAISEAMTGSATGFTEARDMPPMEGESPLHASLRAGIAGAGQSAAETLSSFTSPASIAMMGAGALAKAASVLPRMAQAARAFLTTAGLGFGAQGAVQTVEAAPGALEGKPEEAQKALLGISQVAGSAPAVKTAARTVTPSRETIQGALGIGKRLTDRAQAKADVANEAEVLKTQERNRLEIEKTENFNKLADEQFEAKAQEIGAKNQNTIRQYKNELAEHKRDAAELSAMNERRRVAYEEATRAATEGNEAARAQAAERINLLNDITENGGKLATAVKELGKAVREEGSAKFEEVTKATEGIAANPEVIRAAVEHAERSILKGSPESIKIFKNLLDATTPVEVDLPTIEGLKPAEIQARNPNLYQSLIESGAITPPETTPVTFRDLHGYYSELGQKASGGNLPGDVYQALKYVKEQGVGVEMNRIAAERGVGAKLQEARAFWRAYESVFHDMRAVSRGGSPVARIYRAIDPDFVIRQVNGPAALRAIEQVAAYDPKLARLMRQTMAKARHVETIPKVAKEIPAPREPSYRKIPKPPTEPELKPLPEAPEGKVPELRTPSLEVVDPQAIKLKKIQEMVDHTMGSGEWRLAFDIGHATGAAWAILHGNPGYAAMLMAYPVGRRGIGATLNRPSISQWLSQPSPAELGLPAPPPLPPESFRGTAAQAIAGRKEIKGHGVQTLRGNTRRFPPTPFLPLPPPPPPQ